MTVNELIQKLEKIKNKEKPVWIMVDSNDDTWFDTSGYGEFEILPEDKLKRNIEIYIKD